MAADDAGERTEQPTARRLDEARAEGKIARSADLMATAVMLAGLLALYLTSGALLEGLVQPLLALQETPDLSRDGLRSWIWQTGQSVAPPLLKILALVLLVALATGLLQTRGLVTLKRLQPRLDMLDPTRGIKRLFSTEALTRLGMGLVKMGMVGTVAYLTITGRLPRLLATGMVELPATLAVSAQLIFELALKMALLLLLLALLDYALERWRWWRGLRMTRQEVRDELKQMDGDPHLKQRRRQAHVRLAMQRLRLDVPQADVVVTNPTHFAVALRYDEATMAAPRVAAKGQDFLALQIRQIAQEFGIPIVQRPSLARGLYAAVDVGHEIPPKFYRAIAEVLAYVYQLSGRARPTVL